jgi:hypothetical protein
MSVRINGTTGVTTPNLTATTKVTTADLANTGNYNGGQLGNRNLVINGAMQVAQRGTSFTGLGTVPTYTLDRWRFADSANPPARYTQTQSTDAPDGFSNSLKMEVTTADTSVDADELQNVDYFIEAQDLQQLAYGSSSAKAITVSFWVKCSTTQTFAFRLQHEDGGGGYTKSYTITSSNTWEYKTLTFSGNTTTSLNNDNGRGFRLRWSMCAGSNYTGSDSTAWGNGDLLGQHENTWVATTGATWQITGVQLEVGTKATPFEHKNVGQELLACQRYYQQVDRGSGIAPFTTAAYISLPYITTMRAIPTFGTTGALAINDARVNAIQSTAHVTAYNPNISGSFIQLNNFSGLVQNSACLMRGHAGTFVTLDAEL